MGDRAAGGYCIVVYGSVLSRVTNTFKNSGRTEAGLAKANGDWDDLISTLMEPLGTGRANYN